MSSIIDSIKNWFSSTGTPEPMKSACLICPFHSRTYWQLFKKNFPVEFEKAGIKYRIERGRKPTFTKLYIDGEEQTGYQDDSQGDSRETQADIERLLGMSHDMFKHVVALNTYTEPFLAMRANDQRQVIEQQHQHRYNLSHSRLSSCTSQPCQPGGHQLCGRLVA